jgi:uncharacterized DUF497 family protein
MRVAWSDRKAESNRRKHGVSFEEAVTALMDPTAVTFFDEGEYEEEREITIGHSARHRLLVVVHTEHKGDMVRVISARKATPKERRTYEEGI